MSRLAYPRASGPGTVERRLEVTGTRPGRIRTLEQGTEEVGQRVEVALREERVGTVGVAEPLVSHQVHALLDVRRVTEAKGVPELVQGDVVEVLRGVALVGGCAELGADEDVAALAV